MDPFGPCLVLLVVACLGLAARDAGGVDPPAGSAGASELAVAISERPGSVRLRVVLPDDVPAGSVEVQVAEHEVVVLARDVRGVQRRSRRLRTSQPVVERGARAELAPGGTLRITLRAGPDGSP